MRIVRFFVLATLLSVSTASIASSLEVSKTTWTKAKSYLESLGYELGWKPGCTVEFYLASEVCAEGFTALAVIKSPNNSELNLVMFFDGDSVLQAIALMSDLGITSQATRTSKPLRGFAAGA
jgi:hypothetical protein